ncbi:MAG: matrixin family metalloprotease [Vicinamibacterales bacterium]
MQTRLRLGCAAMLAAWLGLASPASASERVSDDALARSAAAAVQGRVVATSAHWDTDADTIYTFVTIDVAASWGLDGQPARVVVKQLGGLVGGTAFVVGGQALFTVGEDVLVFLDVRPRDNTLSVSGLEQGKWVLNGAPDVATSAVREMRAADPATVVARDYRSTTALQALAALAGSRVRATGAVLEPVMPAPAAGGGHDAPLYTLLATQPARWHEADTATPVFVDTQAGGHPQFAGGGLTQLANAAAKWSAAGSLRLANGVSRSARCFSNSENDGRLSVTYGDPCGEIADASSTLAIGGAYFSSVTRTINGVSYWKITKGMVVTDNPTTKWASFTTGCYEDVLVHEMGHAIGFGHSADRAAIMYPSISSTCFSRTVSAPLGADDLAGMAALYPGAGAPQATTPPGTPTNLVATVGQHGHHHLEPADDGRRGHQLPAARRHGARRDQHRRRAAHGAWPDGAERAERHLLPARGRHQRGGEQRPHGGPGRDRRRLGARRTAQPHGRGRTGRHGEPELARPGVGAGAHGLPAARRLHARRQHVPDPGGRHRPRRQRRRRGRLLRARRGTERRHARPRVERVHAGGAVTGGQGLGAGGERTILPL